MRVVRLSDITLANIWHFLRGTVCYHLYYRGYSWLIPRYIRDQFEWRVRVMRRECYESGSCVECGCRTTALQFSSKACSGGCYPPMMGSESWDRFKAGCPVILDGRCYRIRDYGKE